MSAELFSSNTDLEYLPDVIDVYENDPEVVDDGYNESLSRCFNNHQLRMQFLAQALISTIRVPSRLARCG